MIKHFSIITAIGAFLLVLVCYWQRQQINQIKTDNSRLTHSVWEYQTANNNLAKQYQLIDEALAHAAEQKRRADRESSQLRTQLKTAQNGTQCATAAVPADVIRMQREAIEQTNHLFGHTQNTPQPLPAP